MSVRFRVKEVDNQTERLICVGLIVSDKVIRQLAPILDPNFFTARYTKTVAEWCLEFYEKFDKAPRAHIQNIFEAAKRDFLEDDQADLIEALLVSLNQQLMEEQAQFNEDYVLEEAEKYIKSRKAMMLCEDVSALLSKGQILEAEGRLAGYNIPTRPTAEGDSIFEPEFWHEEEEEHSILFRLPGYLDDLIGPIERDSFISILAPEKRGKSWWLLEMGLRAFRARCNVVFLSCGDMTKKQVRRRLRHMLTNVDPKRPKEVVLTPVLDCWHNQQGKCPLGEETDPVLIGGMGKQKKVGTLEDFPDHVPCSKCLEKEKLNKYYFGRPWYVQQKLKDIAKDIETARKALHKRAPSKRFQLFCFPPATVSVAHIRAHLDILQQQKDFIPDVIIIDYADILLPEQKSERKDVRHQINDTWMALRSLSQERNCAILTATQAKGEAMKSAQVKQWDASEDKRKLAHVTAMIALNQTPAEKRAQVMRVSNLATRDDDFDVERNVQVLQCLSIGKPILYTFPHKEIPAFERKDKEEE